MQCSYTHQQRGGRPDVAYQHPYERFSNAKVLWEAELGRSSGSHCLMLAAACLSGALAVTPSETLHVRAPSLLLRSVSMLTVSSGAPPA